MYTSKKYKSEPPTVLQIKHMNKRRLTHSLSRKEQSAHVQARVNKVLKTLGLYFN